MDTLNPNQPVNETVNETVENTTVETATENTTPTPVQQQPIVEGQNGNRMKHAMPVAFAGEELALPQPVTAKLKKASVRIDKAGNEIVLLDFENYAVPVIRTIAQTKGDLSDFYTKEQLNAMSSTLAVATYNRSFRSKLVNFDACYHEAGAIQTITADSKLYKDGKQQIGAKLPTEKEGIWVEGFLSVYQTDAELDAIIARELNAIEASKKAEAGFAI